MSDYLNNRRTTTDLRLENLREGLATAARLAGNRACVYLTGFFVRGEAGSHSDLDLFIMGSGTRKKRIFRQICGQHSCLADDIAA